MKLPSIFRSMRRAERRSGDAVDAQHPGDAALVELFGLNGGTVAGENVTPDNARECPEVDACIGLNEDTVATLPLDLYQRKADGRERRDDHPLHDLLHNRPNSIHTAAEFKQMLEGWRETHGNGYAFVEWGARWPVALWPVHPNEVRPFRSDGKVFYRHIPVGGPPRTLTASEVLHLKDHPFERDLIRGQSRVKRNRELIGRALATSRYLSSFFGSGAVPKTFLVPPKGSLLTPEQVAEVREQFERRHGGLENRHRVGALNADFDLKTLAVDNEKAQVVEAYGLTVTQIAGVWGVPPHLIGKVDASTSWGTGIEQQSIGFLTYFMRPKLVMWEQALNATLMSSEMRQNYYFEFNVDGLLRGDFQSRMEGFAMMIQWGLATPNEIRRRLNLPPLPGGDDRLTPLNMVPATRIMDVLLKGSAGNERDQADRITRQLAEIIDLATDRSKKEAA